MEPTDRPRSAAASRRTVMSITGLSGLRLLSRSTSPGMPRRRSITTRFRRSSSPRSGRSEEHTSELQSPDHLVCRLLLEKKKKSHKIQSRKADQEREESRRQACSHKTLVDTPLIARLRLNESLTNESNIRHTRTQSRLRG